jgi:hypothetical protein
MDEVIGSVGERVGEPPARRVQTVNEAVGRVFGAVKAIPALRAGLGGRPVPSPIIPGMRLAGAGGMAR